MGHSLPRSAASQAVNLPRNKGVSFTEIRNSRHNGFRVRNIKEDDFSEVYFEQDPKETFNGDLQSWVLRYQQNQLTFSEFLKNVLFMLYTFGIIGLKKDAEYPIQFFYEKTLDLDVNDIVPNTKVYIHKAFYSSLKINVKELQGDVY